jgi:hypothetical protein
VAGRCIPTNYRREALVALCALKAKLQKNA